MTFKKYKEFGAIVQLLESLPSVHRILGFLQYSLNWVWWYMFITSALRR